MSIETVNENQIKAYVNPSEDIIYEIPNLTGCQAMIVVGSNNNDRGVIASHVSPFHYYWSVADPPENLNKTWRGNLCTTLSKNPIMDPRLDSFRQEVVLYYDQDFDQPSNPSLSDIQKEFGISPEILTLFSYDTEHNGPKKVVVTQPHAISEPITCQMFDSNKQMIDGKSHIFPISR